MHECYKGEEIAIAPTLQHGSELDEPPQHSGPLHSITSTHYTQGYCLGEAQVSVEREGKGGYYHSNGYQMDCGASLSKRITT